MKRSAWPVAPLMFRLCSNSPQPLGTPSPVSRPQHPLKKGMVYQIPCECGSARNPHESFTEFAWNPHRFSTEFVRFCKVSCDMYRIHWRDWKAAEDVHCKHKAAVRQANTNNAIGSHVWSSDHTIQWSETSVLEQEAEGYRRRVKEALYIRSSAGSLNTDPSLEPMLGCPRYRQTLPSPLCD